MQIAQNKTVVKWKPRRWWIALIIFWLISATGAGIIVRAGGNDLGASGFMRGILLIFVIFVAVTDKERKNYKRIFWLVGAYIIYILLEIPAGIFVAFLTVSKVIPAHLSERAALLLAAIPIVIWAMRRSNFFIERIHPETKGPSR